MICYLSHPYGGDSRNLKRIHVLIAMLHEANPDDLVISPVPMWSELYKVMDYIDGLDMCLELIGTCDKFYLAGDWTQSKGCIAERAYALALGMEIIELEGDGVYD